MNYNDTLFPTYAPALKYKEKDQHRIPYTALHTLREGEIIVIRFYETRPNTTIGTVRYFIARIRSTPHYKLDKYDDDPLFTANGTHIDDPEKKRIYNVRMEYEVLWIYEGEIPRSPRITMKGERGEWKRNTQTLYHYLSSHTHRYYDDEVENLTSMYKIVLHGDMERKYKSLHDDMVIFHNDKNTQRRTCMEYYRLSYLEGMEGIPLQVLLQNERVGPKDAVAISKTIFDIFPFDIYQMIMGFL